MTELTDADIDAAAARGRYARLTERRAGFVQYERRLGCVVIDLSNGCTFSFPPRLAQGMDNATDDQLVQVEIMGACHGLHWKSLDAELSVPGLFGRLARNQGFHGPPSGSGDVYCEGRCRSRWPAAQERRGRVIGAECSLEPNHAFHVIVLQEGRTMDSPPPATASGVIRALSLHQQALMEAGVTRLSLFGSVARDEAGPDSDIDLAAEFDPTAKMDLIRLVGLERELGELLGRPVEILLEPVKKPRLRANVERDRIRAF